jgi:hypothetical protein
MKRLPWLLLAAACAPPDDETTTAPGTSEPATTSPVDIPDVSDLDLPAVYHDAVRALLDVSTRQPWAGHVSTLETAQPGCPDLWVGGSEDAMMTADDGGLSWSDDCRTDGGLAYDGWMWWDTAVSGVGAITDPAGRTLEASRTLTGDAVVSAEGDVRFEFKGDANDYLYRVDAGEGDYAFERWIYRTTVNGTVTGSDLFTEGDTAPGGYRTDLYVDLTGGDVDRLQARGNVYMFEPVIAGRFDSIQVVMELRGVLGAGPVDCTLEPLGWVGLRDPEAVWYDLVFLPRITEDIIGEPFPNEPLSICDGCGTLYIRGVEAGEVCVDLTDLFDVAEGALPEVDEYVLTLHDL